MHHFIIICELELELWVRKQLSWFLTSVTLIFDLWPWPLWHLSLVTTPENFMMIRLWEQNEKGVTDGRIDWTIHRAAWSQLKHKRNCLYMCTRPHTRFYKVYVAEDASFITVIEFFAPDLMSRYGGVFNRHWWHRRVSLWQPPVQSVMHGDFSRTTPAIQWCRFKNCVFNPALKRLAVCLWLYSYIHKQIS